MKQAQLDVPKLAVSYRRLVLWFGVQLVISIAGMVGGAVLGDTALGALFAVVYLLCMLVTIGALMYYAYRAAAALGSRLAILWAIAMLIPFLNAITLLVLSSRATKACRKAGIPVGLLGPKLGSLAARDSHVAPEDMA